MQNIGEYGALSGITAGVQSAVDWAGTSLEHDRGVWIAAAAVVVVILFVFRRR